MKILSVTSGRADVGILAPVWRAIRAMGAELHVFLTGAHVTDPAAAKAALPQGAVAHMGGEDLAGRLGADASGAMAKIMEDAGALAARLAPDRALVVADRLDMIPAALAFVPFNMPVAHLHGGEQTLGAVDDRARHAITKLAHLHCVANVDAAQRVARMGEEGWRIHVTGAPGLDTIAQAPVMTEAEFAQAVGFDSIAGLRLVTVHPETNAADPLAAYEAVVAALEEITVPNRSREELNQKLRYFCSSGRSTAPARRIAAGSSVPSSFITSSVRLMTRAMPVSPTNM